MSEIEVFTYCPNCKREKALYQFSGSGRKGACLDCGYELSEDLILNNMFEITNWKTGKVYQPARFVSANN